MAKKNVDMIVNFTIVDCDAEFVKFFARESISRALLKAGLLIDPKEIKIEIPIAQAHILAKAGN